MPKQLPSINNIELDELYKFSNVKLVVLDLDGTTVRHNELVVSKLISELNDKLKHHRYGINITIATGRTIHGAAPLINSLKLNKDIPVILYNGSVVARPYDFKILRKIVINSASSIQVIDACLTSNSASVYFYFVEEYDFPTISSAPEWVVGWTNGLQVQTDANGMNIQWQNDLDSLRNSEPCAILIHEPSIEKRDIILSILSLVTGVSCTKSGGSFIEVRPCTSNKAIALQYLSTKCSINSNEIAALGDNDNDAEMLRWAGIGMSVASASSLATESSDYVCQHGVAEGAVEALRLIQSARYYFYNPKKKKEPL